MNSYARWAAWGVVGLGLEAAAFRRHHGTLTEAVQAVCRVDTPHGRALFLTAWSAFAAWFAAHICRQGD